MDNPPSWRAGDESFDVGVVRRGEWACRNAAYAEVDADPDDEDALLWEARSASAESNSDSNDRARAIGVVGPLLMASRCRCDCRDRCDFSDEMRFCIRTASFSNTW